ncbi:MAG: hypothetical protein A3C85_04430 [Candidatus Doudnabacteria bacterium RIFCSPHIGHO2_02_FULL_48_21]|uniref:ABC transporter domain-containing protein n=1 Tax=Candidatus Doudnabacteria bacterium RIFCSPLOWO2_02_FULL_48_13 TaxID=1817845 RepID=A0A1F5QCE3_9BACT|nr:MAG: hypothetical protein A3K05_00635 [Candidatus Doudnabacteria bacterium RIFCSPHIGHO2_01_48_18]OGE79661.1 MAG: hypothetical protein A2668_01015 [Candidatus Doudnabacteria bacterium RIFCSPHIGHO2_01_FULL_48_180]OGE91461.1 MAG: hypothetical protein A3F44_01215 [Candidatus Doudnabacteria bacterium RIFCSPHIGHO2_12_FULL_47_25]OGE93076.1 MAG: hypothetical protein A3C85_04430 [Candidatus Doudnabacteria bacterium RIFCSPHIGHO2_02_FULL_48_21]OGE98083.1 MAG: hypothetical protein A3A83_02395 [Candidatu
MEVIQVQNLKKSYGKIQAVKGVSFRVEEGEVFGLLGPNGAGKTSTLEMLEGLRQPDSGSIKVLNVDIHKEPSAVRGKIGIALQASGYFEYLTLRELLALFGSFYKNSLPVEDLINKFDLKKVADSRFQDLSGGQRQRFVLASALIHKPKLLILDEPTIGLDPQARQKFWDILMELRAEGLTILLSTHYLEEAEIVCDRVAIMDQGKIVANDRPIKLITSLGVASRIRFMCSKPINVSELESLPGISIARRDRYTYDLETEKPEVALRELLEWEKKYSGKIFNLSVEQATLEDVFLKLTGHSLQE